MRFAPCLSAEADLRAGGRYLSSVVPQGVTKDGCSTRLAFDSSWFPLTTRDLRFTIENKLCAMLSAILMMRLFLNDFLSPYLPIPSSPHHHFDEDCQLFYG
jgi:hypothetical protein